MDAIEHRVRFLFQVIRMRDQIEAMFNRITSEVRKNCEFSFPEEAVVAEHTKSGVDDIVDRLVTVYSESFSEEELIAAAKFYMSPLGNKMLMHEHEVTPRIWTMVENSIEKFIDKITS